MPTLGNIHNIQEHAHVAVDANPLGLASVLRSEINLAIWQRQLSERLTGYATYLQGSQWQQQRVLIAANDIPKYFSDKRPSAEGKACFIADVALLADMYSFLFDVEEVGIRLAKLTTAMCPKFHTDKLGCRLITTYAGIGSEWLRNSDVWRDGEGKIAFHANADIQQLVTGEAAMFKGDGWKGNEHSGIVHRSPALEQGQARVVLTIDGF